MVTRESGGLEVDTSLDNGTEEPGVQASRQAANMQWEPFVPGRRGSELPLQQL